MYRVACSIAAALLLSLSAVRPSAQSSSPSIDDLLNLKRVGSPSLSPDGRSVAYTLRETNWDDNEFETEIWVASAGAEPRQVTRGRKSSSQPAWSPDGKSLAFISDRDGKRLLYRIAVDGFNSNDGLGADSGGITLNLAFTSVGGTLPTITTQPSSLTVNSGANASFTVAATGTEPITYQWRLNDNAINGATSATYSISSASAVSLMLAMSMLVTSRMMSADSSAVATSSLKAPGVSTTT